MCADTLIGGTGAARSGPAWRQTYRALEHGTAKNACKKREIVSRFPVELQDFAYAFVDLQERRHLADYDPEFRLTKSEVEASIEVVDGVILAMKRVSAKDRRAFAAYVLFKQRP